METAGEKTYLIFRFVGSPCVRRSCPAHRCPTAHGATCPGPAVHHRLHHKDWKEVPQGRMPLSIAEQDQDHAERGEGEWIYAVQGVPPAGVVDNQFYRRRVRRPHFAKSSRNAKSENC
jgi:hypothetical protein